MPNMILNGICEGLYDKKKICVYLTYGTTDKPKDHKDRDISDFYQHVDEFKSHLLKQIPQIESFLKKSLYTAKEIDFENQAPHPFIAIYRKDNQDMSKDDLTQIKKMMEDFLLTQKKELNKKPISLFKNKKTHANSAALEEKCVVKKAKR